MWFNNMEKIIISILITVTIWGVNTQFTELTVLGPNLYEPNAFSVTVENLEAADENNFIELENV